MRNTSHVNWPGGFADTEIPTVAPAAYPSWSVYAAISPLVSGFPICQAEVPGSAFSRTLALAASELFTMGGVFPTGPSLPPLHCKGVTRTAPANMGILTRAHRGNLEKSRLLDMINLPR